MKVDEVVLVISAGVSHGQWSLGCVIEVVEREDGFV